MGKNARLARLRIVCPLLGDGNVQLGARLRSFRSKVIALGVGAAVVPILILGILSYESQKRIIKDEFRVLLSSLATESAEQIGRWVSDRRIEAETLAKSPNLKEETARLAQLGPAGNVPSAQFRVRRSLLHQSLELIVLGYRWVTEASLTDPRTGKVLVSTDEARVGSVEINQADLPRLMKGATILTSIYPSSAEILNETGQLERGVPTMTVSTPIQVNGAVKGILTLRLNVLVMRKELMRGTRFLTASGLRSLDLYLVNTDGVFLSPSAFETDLVAEHRIQRRSMLELAARVPNTDAPTQAVNACKGLQVGQPLPRSDVDGYPGYRGTTVVGTWMPVAGTEWCVISEVDQAEALAPVTHLLRVTLLVFLGIGGIFAFLAVGLSSTLATPLTMLTALATRMAGGDRSVRFGLNRQDEIGQLATSFDRMAATIEQHVAGLENMVRERTANLVATNHELEREILVRKRAEEQLAVAAQGLRDNEQKFRTLVDNIPGAIYLSAYDADWTMEFLSDAIADIVGYPASHFLQNRVRSYASIVHPKDRELVQTAIRQAVSARTPFIVEYRVLHADGSVRWVYEKGQGVFTGDGKLLWLDGAIFDITERKRAQQRLAAQYAATRVLAESETLSEAIPGILEAICLTLEWDVGLFWSVDRHDQVLRCVDAWTSDDKRYPEFEASSRRQMFPMGAGFPGRVWEDAKPLWVEDLSADSRFPRATVAATEGLRAALGFPVLVGAEVVGVMEFFSRQERQPDEDVLRMLTATGGQVGQFIGRVQAQEALREREEQLRQAQKMEAVGRLAGGIAHDFNNLLTAIMGYSQLLLRKLKDDHPLRRYAVEIHQGGERASRLTGQLLAFSRKQVLQPKVLDLNGIINGLDLMLRRLLGEQIQLEARLSSDLGAVKADPGQVEQVLLNLIVNARDAMSHGGRMTIETANVDLDDLSAALRGGVKPGFYVMVSVRDTGCGMDTDTLQHIFEPFFTTKGREKGTGLGLATVYGIVRQSGGGIEVSSKVGLGTTFTIYLPRVAETVERAAKTVDSTEPLAGSETILLVEDEDAVRSLARQVLEQQGFTVLEAKNGEEALEFVDQHRVALHLLITDVVMPGMSGPEVAEHLGKQQPDLRILYISGYTDNAIGDGTVLEAGTGYLQKPFSPDALLQKVRSILDSPLEATHGRTQ